LRYSGNNILLAHQAQQVYYLSYSHQSLKNWRVLCKVNPEMHTHRYEEYVEGQEVEDVIDVYQEELIEHWNFTVSNGPGLIEFATRHAELMEEEEQSPPKKCLKKHSVLLQDANDSLHVSLKQILTVITFDWVN
jgi:hypothetical protein